MTSYKPNLFFVTGVGLGKDFSGLILTGDQLISHGRYPRCIAREVSACLSVRIRI